ncbi:MAG: hypothetical protein WAP06_02520 [Defluviitoga tunisiensis]
MSTSFENSCTAEYKPEITPTNIKITIQNLWLVKENIKYPIKKPTNILDSIIIAK